jgi:hypothetical protein
LTDYNFQINKNKNRDNVMDMSRLPNFTNREFQHIRDAEPREIERYRRLLTAAYYIPALEHPDLPSGAVGGAHSVNKAPQLDPVTNAFSREVIRRSLRDPREASCHSWQDVTAYYDNLKLSITEFKGILKQHQNYMTSEDAAESPQPYVYLLEQIRTPMPFSSFARVHQSPYNATPQMDYLKFETDVLKDLRDARSSYGDRAAAQEAEVYELHQARIVNALKTVKESELDLRLSFINLYLQASRYRIEQEKAPLEKEVLLGQTEKFLKANLIPAKPDSFSLELFKALAYKDNLSQTLTHIKAIYDQFSPSSNDSDFYSKFSLIKKILEQTEALMRLKFLKPTAKNEFLSELSRWGVLSQDQRAEFNNIILETLRDPNGFSSLRGIVVPRNNQTPLQAALQEAFQFVFQQERSIDYNQEALCDIILSGLRESKNDGFSLFFSFLNQMTEKTTRIFNDFQNTESSGTEQFKEFKNLLLDYLKKPSDGTSSGVMGKSLLELMKFRDDDIKTAAKEFYLRAIKEARDISYLNSLLKPLVLRKSYNQEEGDKPSVYDSVPFRQGDLAECLQQSPCIKRLATVKHSEQILAPSQNQTTVSSGERLLAHYREILDI